MRWFLLAMLVGCTGAELGDTGAGYEWVDETFDCPADFGGLTVTAQIPEGALALSEVQFADEDGTYWHNTLYEHVDGEMRATCEAGQLVRMAYLVAEPDNAGVEIITGECDEDSIHVGVEIPVGEADFYYAEVEDDEGRRPLTVNRQDGHILVVCAPGANYVVTYAAAP